MENQDKYDIKIYNKITKHYENQLTGTSGEMVKSILRIYKTDNNRRVEIKQHIPESEQQEHQELMLRMREQLIKTYCIGE